MLSKAGDVYCVYNTHLKKYIACQITKIEEGEKKPQAVIRLVRRGTAYRRRTIFLKATVH